LIVIEGGISSIDVASDGGMRSAVTKDAEDDVDETIAAKWIIEVDALKKEVIVEKGTRVFMMNVGFEKSEGELKLLLLRGRRERLNHTTLQN
jgi:hypothetical protein